MTQTIRSLLADHEKLDWDDTFRIPRPPLRGSMRVGSGTSLSGTEIKVTGRYADTMQLTPKLAVDLLDHVLRLRRAWSAISLAGRTAYCAVLLECARDRWKLAVPGLDAFIATTWRLVEESDLYVCMEALTPLRVRNRKQLGRGVPAAHAPALVTMLDATWDVATTEIGAEIEDDSPATRIGVAVVAWTAKRAGISLPAMRPFAASKFSELDGWGKRCSRARYRAR